VDWVLQVAVAVLDAVAVADALDVAVWDCPSTSKIPDRKKIEQHLSMACMFKGGMHPGSFLVFVFFPTEPEKKKKTFKGLFFFF